MTESLLTLEHAISRLQQGQLVAIPTETVYGLAAPIDQPAGLKAIFATKERPFFDPLIVHVASISQALSLVADWPEEAQILAESFWPGPLTLILPKNAAVVDDVITAGLGTVGVRMPDHPLTLAVIRDTGPLAAPSANMFGRTSPTTAAHVLEEFNGDVPVIDGGPCRAGVESTIVVIPASQEQSLAVVRPGLTTLSAIQRVLKKAGSKRSVVPGRSAAAPGQLPQHYQPQVPLVLIDEQQAWTSARQEDVRAATGVEFNEWQELRLPGDPRQVARMLYGELRSQAARQDVGLLWLIWQPNWTGEDWQMIRDRVERAAAIKIT